MKALLLVLTSAVAFAVTPTTDIKVDQVGYVVSAPKVAMIAASTQAADFVVRSVPGNTIVFRGKLGARVGDADSGDGVQIADFTSLTKAGRYFIEVPGVGRSWEFAIAPDVYARAYYLATRSFYGQRCGTAVDLGAEFPGFKHDACHVEGAYHPSSGKTGAKKTLKGWHDAGDYGRYVVNSGLSTGTLLWAQEMFGRTVGNLKLDLPESGNGTPDLLNEIRWNLDWMLSMQDEDGGVFHKQTSDRFCGFVMPERDTLVSYVIGSGSDPYKTSCATADFAAVMAIAARAYKPFDRPYAAQTLEAARRAWKWVTEHPNVTFANPQGVSTGAYGDRNCGDELLWASAELWRTTREQEFRSYVLEHYAQYVNTIRSAGPAGWPNVAPMALWTYVLGGSKDEAANQIIRASLAAADEIVKRSAANGYRTSLTRSDYVWGSNGVAANYGVQLLVANALKPDRRYVDAALDNLHYLFGRNALSLSFVTQVGANPYKHPHHRPSGADTNAEPWPGLLSGGPNARPQDPAMRKLPANLPPARMYIDDQESYASNEIAINWNAPLVFVLAGVIADAGSSKK
jgi:endoglucanase